MIRRSFIALACLLALAGCSGKAAGSAIGPMELSDDQQGLVDLLGMGEGVLLFEYETREPYTDFGIWVEIYQNGELVEDSAASFATGNNVPDLGKGRLAVTIRETPDFIWSFALDKGEGGISRATTSEEPYPHPGTSARAFSALTEPVPIEDGKEIVLFAGVYTDSDSFAVYDTQEYLYNPQWIAEQENLHLIKCKFTCATGD